MSASAPVSSALCQLAELSSASDDPRSISLMSLFPVARSSSAEPQGVVQVIAARIEAGDLAVHLPHVVLQLLADVRARFADERPVARPVHESLQ